MSRVDLYNLHGTLSSAIAHDLRLQQDQCSSPEPGMLSLLPASCLFVSGRLVQPWNYCRVRNSCAATSMKKCDLASLI